MQRAFRNFLWPRYVSSAPNLIERVGRVLHWLLVGAAPVLTLLLLAGSINLAPTLLAASALIVTGRAVRYILSAE